MLKVPAIVNTPSSLPTPENENDLNQIPVGTPAAMPVSDQPTGTEFTGAAQINLSSGTVGAKIHYTISTNGTAPADPTAADLEQPSSGIPLPAAASQVADTVYIIKAIAVKEAMTNSPVATFTYTMKAATLRTVFSREVSGSENNKQVDDDKSFPWLTYCGDDQEPDGLDLDELKAKGYKTIHIALDFDIQEHDYAWGYVAVYSGHITSNGAGFNGGVRLTNTWRFEPDGGWKAYNCSFDIALASFTKDFSIGWTADGVSSDRYNLGRRKYTITALK